MKKRNNLIILITTLGTILVLQGCYTHMELTKKVRITRRPANETKIYTYTLPSENDSLVYYQDEDGNIYYEDAYGNINYVEDDSSFSAAYQKGFTFNTPVTQVREYHYYYYDDPFYYDSYDPYYNHFSWNVSFSWRHRYYRPYHWDRYYTGWYGDYSYYNPYWGYSPWYSTNYGYYGSHRYSNTWGGYWYGDSYGYSKKYNRDKRDWDRRGSNTRDRNSYRQWDNTTNDYGYTDRSSTPVSITKAKAAKRRTVVKRNNRDAEKQSPGKSSNKVLKRTRIRSDDVKRNNSKQNAKSNTRVRSTASKNTSNKLIRAPQIKTNSVRIRTQTMIRPNIQKSSNGTQTVQRRIQVVDNRLSKQKNVTRQIVLNKRSIVKSNNTKKARTTIKSTKARVIKSKTNVSKFPSKKTTSSKSYSKTSSKRSSSSRSSGSSSYRSNSGSRSSSTATSSRSSSSAKSRSRSQRK